MSTHETDVLTKLRHHNIVRLYESFVHDGKTHLVLEKHDVPLSDMIHMRKQSGVAFSDVTMRSIMVQCCRGLEYLGNEKIMHRDIKPQNIMLSVDGRVVLIDFSLAASELDTRVAVSLWYRPMELLLFEPFYTSAIDVWALGCVFYETMRAHDRSFHHLFMADEAPSLYQYKQCKVLVERMGFPSWPGIDRLPDYKRFLLDLVDDTLKSNPVIFDSSPLGELIAQMLRLNFSERPTCAQLVEYFNTR